MKEFQVTPDRFFVWPRGLRVQVSPYFSNVEFECPCGKCGDQRIAIDLVNKLSDVRHELGRPIKVTSGYRCHNYQLDLAARGYETATGTSQHELGRAADITCPGAMLHDFAKMLVLCEEQFMAIGEGLSFLHVDLRTDKPGRRWYYGIRK